METNSKNNTKHKLKTIVLMKLKLRHCLGGSHSMTIRDRLGATHNTSSWEKVELANQGKD